MVYIYFYVIHFSHPLVGERHTCLIIAHSNPPHTLARGRDGRLSSVVMRRNDFFCSIQAELAYLQRA